MISFRDPGGALVVHQDRVLRIVGAGAPDLTAFLASTTAQKLFRFRRLPQTTVLGEAQAAEVLADAEIKSLYGDLNGQLIVEHERIGFLSFSYEWPSEMLHAAGALTLELAQALLPESFGLKDATPLNILFRATEPVFVDLLSFERREPGDSTWLPYAQFVRAFLLPLLVNKYFGVPLNQIFSASRDGLEPEEVYRYLGPLQKLRPPFLGLVSMPAWLGARHRQDDTSIYQKKVVADPAKARFILDHLLNRLRRTLNPSFSRGCAWVLISVKICGMCRRSGRKHPTHKTPWRFWLAKRPMSSSISPVRRFTGVRRACGSTLSAIMWRNTSAPSSSSTRNSSAFARPWGTLL